MRQIPLKNYLIVSIIGLCTIILAFVISKSYLEQKKNIMEVNIDFATEIMENELDNFIVENHDLMIYVTDVSTINMDINRKLKSIIEDGNYQSDLVHFDKTSLTHDIKDIFSKYNSKNYDIKSNSLIIIKNEQIVNVVDLTKTKTNIKNHIKYYYGD